jgi:hypothetical protein
MVEMEELKFSFVDFEVYMVYGFRIKPKVDMSFFENLIKLKRKETKSKNLLRNGWNTFYKMTSGNSELIQNIKIGDEAVFELERFNKKNSNRWFKHDRIIKTHVNKYLSIRQDGIGTITLHFKFPKRHFLYTTSDVLRVLLLAPRTVNYADDIEELTSFHTVFEKPKGISDLIWPNLSPSYQLFLQTMLKLNETFEGFPKWTPHINGNSIVKNSNDWFFMNTEDECEEISFNTDSQVPYMYVYTRIPQEEYKDSFWDDGIDGLSSKQKERSKFTKEISAILGRWLAYQNIKYNSIEYRESIHGMENGAYKTMFMNSTVFVIISSMVTLTIAPFIDKNDNKTKNSLINTPINISKETILRFIEFLRIRWHCIISINYGSDVILQKIFNNKDLKNENNKIDIGTLNKSIEYLILLEKAVAQNFLCPSHFMLDASLGSSINSFINQSILNEVENEVSRKIQLIRDIIDDKWTQLDLTRLAEKNGTSN